MSSAIGEMNLLELREAYPDLFYAQQWFIREPFMRVLPDPYRSAFPPKGIIRVGKVPPLIGNPHKLPAAVDLAHAFVSRPTDPIWQHWFWCSDTDSLGQRIYVGGATESNGHRFEIHRHLHVTERWGEAVA